MLSIIDDAALAFEFLCFFFCFVYDGGFLITLASRHAPRMYIPELFINFVCFFCDRLKRIEANFSCLIASATVYVHGFLLMIGE